MNKEEIIEVENLTVNYDKTPVLWQINVALPAHKLIAIVGPNGAGKSTFLKALLGLQKPISGSVTFWGLPYAKVRKQVGYVPQRASVDWEFPINVLDVVLMGRFGKLGLLKWVRAKDREAAEQALDQVGMLPFAKRQISELSGGQQQRVFFARALVQDAQIYLMDEPFAGIDTATEKALIEMLIKLKEKGKTLLIVHHDLATVKGYFDWVVLLNTCLIANGPISEAFNETNIRRTYGSGAYLFEEAKRLSQSKGTGL